MFLNVEKICGVSFFLLDMFFVVLIWYYILLWCLFFDSFVVIILVVFLGGIFWFKDLCFNFWININDNLKWDKVFCFYVVVVIFFDLCKLMFGYNKDVYL